MKSQAAEAALPAFDLGKKVGQKIALQKFRTPIVLCVVDLADFDGSLPRKALLSLLPRSVTQKAHSLGSALLSDTCDASMRSLGCRWQVQDSEVAGSVLLCNVMDRQKQGLKAR